MNDLHDTVLHEVVCAAKSHQSIASAKANLLACAEGYDARKDMSTRSLATIATTGMFAVIGGMVIARIVTSPKKSNSASGWVKRAVAALIFRAVMARVQKQIEMRTSSQ